MAQPKRKTSKMKKRQRKASCYNWKGVQTQLCECDSFAVKLCDRFDAFVFALGIEQQ